MKMKILVLAAVLFSTLGETASLRATSMVSMSMEQLAQASSEIVQGQVVSQFSAWNSTHTQIITTTTVAVTQSLKGNALTTVEIHQLGGTVGTVTVTVMGDISLRDRGEYVLFLEPDNVDGYRVVGMSQGAYAVYEDASAQSEHVILPMSQAGIQSLVRGGGNPTGTVPLAGFHKYVASIVAAPVQIPHGLRLPVAIAYTEARGTGRAHVYGKTTAQLFPSPTVVIPAGTEVEGEAILSAAGWTIHWDEVNLRGVHAEISATNMESEGTLRGRHVILNLR